MKSILDLCRERAYIEPARHFFAPRMVALLNQVMELRRQHAQRTGKPLDMQPTTKSYLIAGNQVEGNAA